MAQELKTEDALLAGEAKPPKHKDSTDIGDDEEMSESSDMDIEDNISCNSELSELSDTSGIDF